MVPGGRGGSDSPSGPPSPERMIGAWSSARSMPTPRGSGRPLVPLLREHRSGPLPRRRRARRGAATPARVRARGRVQTAGAPHRDRALTLLRERFSVDLRPPARGRVPSQPCACGARVAGLWRQLRPPAGHPDRTASRGRRLRHARLAAYASRASGQVRARGSLRRPACVDPGTTRSMGIWRR